VTSKIKGEFDCPDGAKYFGEVLVPKPWLPIATIYVYVDGREACWYRVWNHCVLDTIKRVCRDYETWSFVVEWLDGEKPADPAWPREE
jgi:hypothetical protein